MKRRCLSATMNRSFRAQVAGFTLRLQRAFPGCKVLVLERSLKDGAPPGFVATINRPSGWGGLFLTTWTTSGEPDLEAVRREMEAHDKAAQRAHEEALALDYSAEKEPTE
jgi:hypothetical protein